MKLKSISLTIAAMAFAAGAQAQILSPTAGAIAGAAAGSNATSGAAAGASATSNPVQVTTQQQGQQQGQAQGQQQKANATSGSLSAASGTNANQQGITINNPGHIDYSGGYSVKSAPSFALGGPASGPCNGLSAGIAASFMGGGFAANMSQESDRCNAREEARIAALAGRMEIANAIIEEFPAYQAALKAKQERAAAQKKAELAPTPVASVPAMKVASAPSPQEQNVNSCTWAKSTGDQFLAARHCPK